ncbi:MAG: tetratricopeptide repeat protein [Bacteroidota bacterium]
MNKSKAWHTNLRWCSIALMVLCFLLYANTLGHDFALDDSIVLTSNDLVKQGPSAWGELFSHDSFYGFFGEEKQLVEGGRYRPLTLAMFSLEYQIFGDHATGYHFINILWYIACVLLLYHFFVAVARHRNWDLTIPFIIAIIFCVHPIHTEVVANIKGRDEIVALCAALGSTWLVWRACLSRSWLHAGLAGLLFFLGLMAKENTITFLAVIPLWLFAFCRPFSSNGNQLDFRWSDTKYMAGCLLATILFLGLRSAVLPDSPTNAENRPPRELMNNPFLKIDNGRWVDYTFSEKTATISATFFEYIGLLVWPQTLSHDYYPKSLEVEGWQDYRALLGLVLTLGLLILGCWLAWKKKLAGIGILTYFICLSIFSNVVFPIGTLMSERFLFMPSVGFALVVAGDYQRLKTPWRKQSVTYFLIFVVLAFSIRTVFRNPVWKDNYTLFTLDVENQPNSAKLQNAAGGVKIDSYLQLPKTQQVPNHRWLIEAEQHLDRAIEIHPTYKSAHFLRGRAAYLRKSYPTAIAYLQRALEFDNDSPEIRSDLLTTLSEAAKDAGQNRGDLDQAQAYIDQALQLDSSHYPSLRLQGVIVGVSGNPQGAISWFERAAQVRPDEAGAWYDLGTAYYQAGDQLTGQQYIDKAVQMNPNILEERRAANQ